MIKSLPVLSNINIQAKYLKRYHYLRKKQGTLLYQKSCFFRKKVDAELSKANVLEAPALSLNSIAQIINCSLRSANSYKSFMINHGMIKSFIRENILVSFPTKSEALAYYRQIKPGNNVFVKRSGTIVKRLACGITNQDPEVLRIVGMNYAINIF